MVTHSVFSLPGDIHHVVPCPTACWMPRYFPLESFAWLLHWLVRLVFSNAIWSCGMLKTWQLEFLDGLKNRGGSRKESLHFSNIHQHAPLRNPLPFANVNSLSDTFLTLT